MSRRESRSQGFSLMEVLVGLTLLALISVSVTQMMRTGLLLWQASERDDAGAELTHTGRLVEGWLARALPPRAFDPDGPAIFVGQPSRLTFLVDGHAGRKLAGYSRMTLAAVPSEACRGGADLVLTWEDVAAAAQFEPAAADSRILLACADTIHFRYGGPRPGQQGYFLSDSDSWADRSSLPLRVSVEATAGGRRFTITSRLVFAGY